MNTDNHLIHLILANTAGIRMKRRYVVSKFGPDSIKCVLHV